MKFVRKEIGKMPIEEYAPDEQKGVKSNMALNINPFGVSKKVLNRLKSIKESTITHYYSENRDLLKAIAKYTEVSSQNILLGDGCDGCLEMIAHTFVESNDEVLIPTPTFHRYEFHVNMMGGKVRFSPMLNFELKAEKILALTNKHQFKILFICNPNNPTGVPINKSELQKIIKCFKGLIVIDEALADGTNVSSISLLKKHKNLIITRSFSKIMGLAALRIGYIVANKELIQQIRKITSPFKANGLAQELALEAVKDVTHVEISVKNIAKQREYLFNELDKINLEYTDSITTNFLLDISSLNKNTEKIISNLKKNGVLVTDTKAFKLSKKSYLRIAVSNKQENKFFIKEIKKIK